jgi:hypothetical protein
MKLNIDIDRLRLRLSEAELEQVLAHGRIDQMWNCPDGTTAHCALTLDTLESSNRCLGNLMRLEITLQREAFAAFAAERPRRDGFAFSQGKTSISVDIDVRDSHRLRTGRTETTSQPVSPPSMNLDGRSRD